MTRKVIWDSAPVPRFHSQRQPVFLSDQTMKERRDKILTRMAEHQLDCLAVYCDMEHGSNFEYLTGFLTRFEESVLLLFKTGRAVLLQMCIRDRDRTCGTKIQTSRRVKRRPNAACRYLPESDSKSQIDSG